MIKPGFLHRALCICAAISMAACAAQSAQTVPASQLVSPASGSCCNIFWSKHRLRLPYPPKTHKTAVLTYWGPNGYYLTAVECKNGGKIAASAHHTSGDPKAYMHVVYWFEAQTAGPDECGVSAVLNNTGSPPIAVLKFHIAH
jgi:hypothetical protein